ncbi:Uncharacterized protein FKW44_012641 [Caligus rogercresseyi]|uniref:Uncharacterized protein n=2 Tax=Caligus rogercresseyi TaxID=217165 RepID=A0A7T8HJN1_CALRO|nr:Uncharacterized protein FKW44_012641 [Caligus rogercresseyi]
MTHTLRSTPTSGIEAVLGITPLDLYIQAHATKSRWRTKFFLRDTWDGVGNLSSVVDIVSLVIKYSIDFN